MQKSILEILDTESIRLIDGRYSDGFVDLDDLKKLIDMGGYVVLYNIGGVTFVRKNIQPVQRKEN
jgi:hypothetical protein